MYSIVVLAIRVLPNVILSLAAFFESMVSSGRVDHEARCLFEREPSFGDTSPRKELIHL